VEIEFDTNSQPCILGISLSGYDDAEGSLVVYDADDPSKVFTKRDVSLDNNKRYFVRMPISSEYVVIGAKGKNGEDIEIVDVEMYDFEENLSHEFFTRDEVNSFIDFAEEFITNSSNLTAGETKYYSDDDVYTIVYRDVIKDGGEYVPTPARINQADGTMEVSKKHFDKYSIPMRMAILLHEFAHFYLNDVMTDEIEADRNSLNIYMGLGYPRIDAYNVYLDVFEHSPSELNVDRYEALNRLIRNHN
jgi:hypothetical protein